MFGTMYKFVNWFFLKKLTNESTIGCWRDWINFDPAVSNRGSSNSSAVWGEEGYLDVYTQMCFEKLFLIKTVSEKARQLVTACLDQLFQILGLQISQLCEARRVISMCGKATKGSEVKEDTMCREAIFGPTLFQPEWVEPEPNMCRGGVFGIPSTDLPFYVYLCHQRSSHVWDRSYITL